MGSLSYNMDLSKLQHGLVLVVIWICQSCSMYLSPFAKQNQAEDWPRFHSLLKLLLWAKGVGWVKVINALDPLCLWQCLYQKVVEFWVGLHLLGKVFWETKTWFCGGVLLYRCNFLECFTFIWLVSVERKRAFYWIDLKVFSTIFLQNLFPTQS